MLYEDDDLIFIGEAKSPGIMDVTIKTAKRWREDSKQARTGTAFLHQSVKWYSCTHKISDKRLAWRCKRQNIPILSD